MKGINIFNNQVEKFDSLGDLGASAPYQFLQKVYGNLLLCRNESGLLKVNKTKDGKIIVAESCFEDPEMEGEKMGYLIPNAVFKSSFLKVNKHPSGTALSKDGFFCFNFDMSEEFKERIMYGEYEENTPEKDLENLRKEYSPKAEVPPVRGEETVEIFDTLKARPMEPYITSSGYPIPVSIRKELMRLKVKIEAITDMNPLICAAKTHDVSIKRWGIGSQISRHTDTTTNSIDQYILTALLYLVDAPFIGRELVIGKRTEKDLVSYIDSVLNYSNDYNGYNSTPKDFVDTAIIKPEMGLSVVMNAFNPIFYHGVEKMDIGNYVYTVITNFNLNQSKVI